MKIFSYFTKYDSQIVARSIASLFKKVNGEYDVVYATIANHWLQYENAIRNLEPLVMAANNQLPNLSMLAVAEIHALNAKRNTSFESIKEKHYEKIVTYLEKQKIPQQYINGDNFKASKKAAEIIKNRLKEKGIKI